MSGEKKMLLRLLMGGALLLLGVFIPIFYLSLAFYLMAYLTLGFDVLFSAGRNLFSGRLLDENFLMAIATVGAMAIGEYREGVLVMLLFQTGELFSSYAVGRSRKSIVKLMDLRPDRANLLKGEETQTVHPSDVKAGDRILVNPAEKVPLDGVVRAGSALIDASMLTGEPEPLSARAGSEVLSGTVNVSGSIIVEVTKEYSESTAAKIMDMIENVSGRKAKSEAFITRFSRVYTPIVVALAALLALLAPLILRQPFQIWLHRSLMFLVVSCPCALVISVPLSYFAGLGAASKAGILIKGSAYLEALSEIGTLALDKTGTLTDGVFRVQKAEPASGTSKEELLKLAAHAEWHSAHPMATAIKEAYQGAYGGEVSLSDITDMKEEAGMGVFAQVFGKPCAVGKAVFIKKHADDFSGEDAPGAVHVAYDGKYAGAIHLGDRLKKNSKEAVVALQRLGVSRIAMLTGDKESAAKRTAEEAGISEVYAGLLPMDKVARVEELKKSVAKGKKLAFAGDGINDAPVLALADVGVSMGLKGRDAAIEASDVVLSDDDLLSLAEAVEISRRTRGIIRENIGFSLAVKFACLALSAFGVTGMLVAVLADVGVMSLAVLNSLRALIPVKKREGRA